jgi:hypothetical protein
MKTPKRKLHLTMGMEGGDQITTPPACWSPSKAQSVEVETHLDGNAPQAAEIHQFTMIVFSTGGSVCSHLFTLVPRSRDFYNLKMEAIRSSETSIHTRSTRRHIPEDSTMIVTSLQAIKTSYVLISHNQ